MLIDELAHIKGWVFDLDGTLTQPVHDFVAMRKALDIPLDADILGYISEQPAHIQAQLNADLYKLELEYAYLAKPALGAQALISFLDGQSVCLGILTRNDRTIALATLDAIGLGQYFHDDHVLGRDEALPKPSGAGILALCDQWGVAPEQSVMVGDYIHDMGAGRDAGSVTVNIHAAPDTAWQSATDIHATALDGLFHQTHLHIERT